MGCLETVSGLTRGDIRGLKICRDMDNIQLHLLMQVEDGMLGNYVWAQQGQHQRLENLQRYRQYQVAGWQSAAIQTTLSCRVVICRGTDDIELQG